MAETGPRVGFIDDVRASLQVWRRYPALPLLSVAVVTAGSAAAAPTRGDQASPTAVLVLLLLTPVAVFATGLLGTERLWYLRAYRELPVDAALVWRSAWRYVGRFLRLGLLLAVIAAPAYVAAIAVAVSRTTKLQSVRDLPYWFYLLAAAVSLLIDLLATFMTPALAMSTASATTAWRIGLRALRSTWPRGAPYVLIPPLAVIVFVRVVPPLALPRYVGVLAVAVSGVANLLAKGAVLRFYLREIDLDTGDFGSLAMSPQRQPKIPPRLQYGDQEPGGRMPY